MKVLVCGSEGSLMQAVIPKLIAKGHKVYGVDNLSRYGKRGEQRGYDFLCGDLMDPFFVDDAFAQCQPDMVIQAAAKIYGVGGFNAYRADILGDDITLHTNVLKACVTYAVNRVVYISSSMVYETVDGEEIESAVDYCIAPRTDYGLSKFVGERLVKAYNAQYNLQYTIWRPFNIITPHEVVTTEDIGTSHVFADYIKNIVVKKLNPLPIIGEGNQVRCFTWIDDVAEAIAEYSNSPMTVNEVFNLGNLEPISMKELARLIYATNNELNGVTESQPLEFVTIKNYKNDVIRRIPSINRAKVYLGWSATKTTRDSIRECILQLPKEKKEEGGSILKTKLTGLAPLL